MIDHCWPMPGRLVNALSGKLGRGTTVPADMVPVAGKAMSDGIGVDLVVPP